ncbi:uncharacterized protein DNG_06834 [Cephalotrichum gorgonifer]|uniref:NB-ARC domain-containing protein n=1 Tax=Cephalotrichum gorgonifer TaxID=2041049 RepID=A0AAE8N0J4_9PEZI|nr:uncharacterized protein DNG_06834 [Cephalotrichum gorgonifer]
MGQERLHTIYTSDDPPEIDIVAVHGLNFKNSLDHAWKTWTSGESLWLRDFLPSHALVEALLNRSFKAISDAARLLVFFATPHQGGNYATIGEVVAKIVRAGLRKPGNDLLRALQKDSDVATRRFEQSRHLYDRCLVVSFFESESYGKLGLIVDKRSATLNLPESREKQIALPADHSSLCKFESPDTPICKLVLETISSEIERAIQLEPVNTHWLVPRSVNPLFAGREDILRTIQKAISRENKTNGDQQRRFVITGMGGQGKSEVCLAIANRLRDSYVSPMCYFWAQSANPNRFWGVFWVDVSSEATATMGFLKILQMLGCPGTSIDDARHQLSNAPAENDWLLILDNADDPETDYEAYFPSGTRGAVLMTSRDPESERYASSGVEALGSIGEEDCIKLLLRSARIPEVKHLESTPIAKQVLEELNSHTLAVLQAGAYVAQGYCKLEQFPKVYQQQCERLLKFSPRQARSRYCNVYATFESSAQVLEGSQTEETEDALALLGILSALHYQGVPLDLFEDAWTGSKTAQQLGEEEGTLSSLTGWHVSQLPLLIGASDELWDSFRLFRALNQLQSLALVQMGNERGVATVSMHPLAHRWLVIRQARTVEGCSMTVAGCLAALSQYRIPEWRAYRGRIPPHLQSVRLGLQRQGKPSRRIIQILVSCGWALQNLRRDQEVQDLLDWLGRQMGVGLESAEWAAGGLDKLAAANMCWMGRTKEAIRILERKAMAEIKLEQQDPDRIDTLQRLGDAYHSDGRPDEAIPIFEHIISLGGGRHKELAQYSVACIYSNSAKTLQRAVRIFEHLARSQKALDESNPTRFHTQHELARVYADDRKPQEAVQIFEDVAEAQEALEDNHPDRLNTQHELAKAYLANGQTREAVQMLEHVVRAHAASKDDNYQKLCIEGWLASAYIADGQRERALPILERVVRVRAALAESHPDRLSAEYGLASVYAADGRLEEAIKIFEHVARVSKTALYEGHPIRVQNEEWLAAAYKMLGERRSPLKYSALAKENGELTSSQPGRYLP